MKAYVLFSGGIDSATTLALAKHYHGPEVMGVSFNYGQKHSIELDYARSFADRIGVHHQLKAIEPIHGSPLTDGDVSDIPNKTYDQLTGVSPSYVPFRNGLLISNLAAIAAADPEAEAIYIGTHAEDALAMAYPDCTLMFIGAMASAVYIGTYHKIQLHAPFIESMKADVVKKGHELGVPYELTWSCYRGEGVHCGACPTCHARKEAFRLANVVDPTVYTVHAHNKGG